MTDGRQSEPVYDVAIVGAGVSGLTLAWMLTRSRVSDFSILLVDGARDDDELRTLSFWDRGPNVMEGLVQHSWRTLRIQAAGGRTSDVPLAEHTYRTLFFADLQRTVKDQLSRRPSDLVVEGRVQDLVQDAEGATVLVGDATYRARWVLDSRFSIKNLHVDERRFHNLRQYFHGWVVRTPQDAFDHAVATLIDFRVAAPPGTAFCYVLPFSARQALVELVSLEPVDAEPLIRSYLSSTLGLDEVEFLDRESGVSPMTEQPFGWRDGARVRRIGAPAGRIKPSTGYAFTRICTDCARIVQSLERQGHPFARPEDSAFYRFLDSVLLEIWQNRPELIPGIFEAMFRRNPGDRVLRFLDERARAWDVVRLVFSLPPLPFLRALLAWGMRRWRPVR